MSIVLLSTISGCSFIKKIPFLLSSSSVSKKAPVSKPPKTKKTKKAVVNSVQITKHQAIEFGKIFVQSEGFEDEFRIKKPYKVKLMLSMEREPRWIWRLYFPGLDQSVWTPWKRSPLLVDLDAETGKIIKWGRR
jgi:hypothetical protein